MSTMSYKNPIYIGNVKKFKDGDQEAYDLIYNHYHYIVDNYVSLFNKANCYECAESLYKYALESYKRSNTDMYLFIYIKRVFDRYFEGFSLGDVNPIGRKHEVSDLIELARTDSSARMKVYEKYLYIVEDILKENNDDELRSYLYYKYIKSANDYFNNNINYPFSSYINIAMRNSMKRVNREDDFVYGYDCLYGKTYDLQDKILVGEILDIINSDHFSELDRTIILKTIYDKESVRELANELGISHTLVAKKYEKAIEKIRGIIGSEIRKSSTDDLIKKAKVDVNARNKLVEKYMYVIDQILISDDEDARAFLNLALVEIIDEYIKSNQKVYLSQYINRNIKIYYKKYLNKKNPSYDYCLSSKYEYDDIILNSEISSILNTLDDFEKEVVVRYVVCNETLEKIEESIGFHKSLISVVEKRALDKIKSLYYSDEDNFSKPRKRCKK